MNLLKPYLKDAGRIALEQQQQQGGEQTPTQPTQPTEPTEQTEEEGGDSEHGGH
ncbi:MAG: hypothetical protein H0U54_11015 [Acidobacteria bacterium]|nr:hypothetical protein [Acidobacteriota bacterium]